MTTAGGEDSDETLAARARDGNREAFEALIGRHKNVLYRFVRRYVSDADDAYDVLQNTFIAVWNGLGRYDPGRPFAPWLCRIALNKCRDFGRRQTVRRLLLGAYARDPSEPMPQDAATLEAEAEAERQEVLRLGKLDRAIARLPAIYKEPLLLTTAGGLSQHEAAVVLKTTTKAIEMRLYRARQKLTALLGEG